MVLLFITCEAVGLRLYQEFHSELESNNYAPVVFIKRERER